MDEQDGMTERQSVAEAAGAEVTVAAEEDTAEKAGAVSERAGAAEEGVVAKTAVVAEVTAESEERASGGAEEMDGMGTAASEESANPAKEAGTWEAEWQRKVSAYAAKAVYSEARAVAAMLGVPENRLDYAARLADLSGVDPDEPGVREKIAGAVRAVLKDVPELCAFAGTGKAVAARKPRMDAFERGFLGD